MLKVGDIVSWSSQGAGHWKEKTGLIVEVFERNGSTRYRVQVWPSFAPSPKYYCPWPSVLRKLR